MLKKIRPKNKTTTKRTTTNYTSRCGSDAPTDFIDVAQSIGHGIWNLIDWSGKEHSEDFTCGNELRLQSLNLVNRDLVLDPSLCGPPQTISWGQVIKLRSVTFVSSGRTSIPGMVAPPRPVEIDKTHGEQRGKTECRLHWYSFPLTPKNYASEEEM